MAFYLIVNIVKKNMKGRNHSSKIALSGKNSDNLTANPTAAY